ncbi:NADH dehydrogenase-like protein SAV0941 [Arcanobacterium haemolyticum]|uniref:NAD(P)/FAD-dependent oxidoreductase n=1 Tax=Arcanobacterium haemolyticum TaxID=28264 RepID=UPI000D943ED5|nr:NAD(P)/FAD-dependent oxidoreductase [Arcanobacterium haemolyticum]SPT75969.1 NADH dehydrogenase-like protein SAV0941 [Arcanobacterium haemolyticum]
MSKHHVVVIGSGFGGLFATKALRKADVSVTMISRTSHHLFQPLLYQVATGILSPGEIAPTTREILSRQENASVLLGLVEDIDVDAKEVIWRYHNREMRTGYDSLIVAAGADQSYFGNDQFARFAPGLKNIDDALEIRARILGAFELAELEPDPQMRKDILTFVVVGAGPTGVEVAGQIRELASKTLRKEFRNFDPREARVILVDGADYPLPPFGESLGKRTRKALEKLGIEVMMGQMVIGMTDRTVTLRDREGNEQTINTICKVWSAGVQGSSLGKKLAERTGVELDRAGRVRVNDDLTIPGHPEIFVVGDMMSLDGVPGVAQGAIQPGRFAARAIIDRLAGKPSAPKFVYNDKGSMATIAKSKAVVKIGKLEFDGFVAWLAWCVLHILTLSGFKTRFSTLMRWAISYLSHRRSERSTTNQQLVGRLALKACGDHASGHLILGDVDPEPLAKIAERAAQEQLDEQASKRDEASNPNTRL